MKKIKINKIDLSELSDEELLLASQLGTKQIKKLSIMEKKDKTDAKAMKALYKRAIGFYQEEEQVSNYKGEMRTAVVMKYHPPDTEACRLWLEIKEKERNELKNK